MLKQIEFIIYTSYKCTREFAYTTTTTPRIKIFVKCVSQMSKVSLHHYYDAILLFVDSLYAKTKNRHNAANSFVLPTKM